MPPNLVRVIPERTLLPMLVNTFLDLSTLTFKTLNLDKWKRRTEGMDKRQRSRSVK